jgi:phenylpyruvate tautomerase PptA (4-oxalocrotonate tautomerase family)
MPLVRLETSVELDDARRQKLLTGISGIVADVTGKPESYVMVTVQQAAIAMAGAPGPAAFADVRGIGGLGGDVNKRLSKAVCDLLNSCLGLEADAVYLTFTDVPAPNWGWNGGTFG